MGLDVGVGQERVLAGLELAQPPEARPQFLVGVEAVAGLQGVPAQPPPRRAEGGDAQAQAPVPAHGVAPQDRHPGLPGGRGQAQEEFVHPARVQVPAQGQGEGEARGHGAAGVQVREVHHEELAAEEARGMPVAAEMLPVLHEVGGDQEGLAGRGRRDPPAVVRELPAARKKIPDPGEDGIFR